MTEISTYDLWQALLSEVNVQQRGQIRPVEDFLYWLNKINQELFRERVDAAELSQQLDDDLSPFKKSINAYVTILSGKPYDKVAYPADYAGFADMRILRNKQDNECAVDCNLPAYQDNGKCLEVVDKDYAAMEARYVGMNLVDVTVTKIDTQRWGSCMAHPTKGPTFDNPKITQNKDGFFIAPKGVTSVVLDYYTTPRNATFNYSYGPGDIIVYNPSTSINLQWNITLFGEFMARLKKVYAVHVGDAEIYQTAENDRKSLA